MDSFELNKMIGGFLAAVFILFTISIVSDAIFASPAPENPGFVIAAAEEGAGNEQAAEEEKGLAPIAPMLASADVAAGENVFKKCASCHSIDKGGANKVGPNLWGVVDRPIASHEGFSYSSALQDFAQGGSVVWDYEHLNGFLHKPKEYVKGTAMGFAGLKKDEDRANLIAWMRQQADTPAPLPE